MLDSILIKNFAIIDQLQLEFGSGLSALTGETGAGKSIILDAIKLIAGDRAESDSIRSGAEKAEISVCFALEDAVAAKQWLHDNDMDADEDCVIRRVLSANGRSKAYINGYNATLPQLRALCECLVDIHGQHEHQSLQKSEVQQSLLDAFMGDSKLIETVQQKYLMLKNLRHRFQQSQGGSKERDQRVDLLHLYHQELTDLSAQPDEFEQLQEEHLRLANAENLIETTEQILARLYDDEGFNLQSGLSQCVDQLKPILSIDSSLSDSFDLINAALIQVQEAVNELRSYRDKVELDEGRLDLINNRIAVMQAIARKHRVDVAELPTLESDLAAELESLQGDAFNLDVLQKGMDAALADFQSSAEVLSKKRQKTAAKLSRQISEVMQQLGMHGGQCVIDVEQQPQATAAGIDRIRYLVSANPGQPPRPLARVASGGELSRISLAIQVIMSESSYIPTLIFDEVDSGVGGAVAEIVGKKMRLLGKDRQVFCVTHLPQVASQAHHHFRVEKIKHQQDTTTQVAFLDQNERLEEIARMLGGLQITNQTRAHASEMMTITD